MCSLNFIPLGHLHVYHNRWMTATDMTDDKEYKHLKRQWHRTGVSTAWRSDTQKSPLGVLVQNEGCDMAGWSPVHSHRRLYSSLFSPPAWPLWKLYLPTCLSTRSKWCMQTNPRTALCIDCQTEEKFSFSGASLSRPLAGLRPRPAHLFPYYLELSFKQLVAGYFDLLPEDFVPIFSCNPMALLPFCSQSTGHPLGQRKKNYIPDLCPNV